MSTRRGVTLIELAVAIVVAAVLLTMAIRVQVSAERIGRGRLERIGASAALRAVAGLVRWEWSGLGADSLSGPDFVIPAPGRVIYRGAHGLLVICSASADSVLVDVTSLTAWRQRLPIAGRDSLLLYLPGDSAAVDAWLPVAVINGPNPAVCPGGATAVGYRLAARPLGEIAFGPTVARSFESLELRSYGSGGTWQLGQVGLASAGVVQPAVGPLANNGFVVDPIDAQGYPATVAVASGLAVQVRVLTARDVAVGPGVAPQVQDSQGITVRLINVP